MGHLGVDVIDERGVILRTADDGQGVDLTDERAVSPVGLLSGLLQPTHHVRRPLVRPSVCGATQLLIDRLEGLDEWPDAECGDVRGVLPGEVVQEVHHESRLGVALHAGVDGVILEQLHDPPRRRSFGLDGEGTIGFDDVAERDVELLPTLVRLADGVREEAFSRQRQCGAFLIARRTQRLELRLSADLDLGVGLGPFAHIVDEQEVRPARNAGHVDAFDLFHFLYHKMGYTQR